MRQAANAFRPIRRLIRAASRWRWVLLGGVALGAVAGILMTALETRQYSSTARLEITRDTDRVVDIDSVERDTSVADQEFYQTAIWSLADQGARRARRARARPRRQSCDHQDVRRRRTCSMAGRAISSTQRRVRTASK